MPPIPLSDEKTIEIAKQKNKGTKEDIKNGSSDLKKTFAHMIIDFDIVPTAIGFSIAFTFTSLMGVVSCELTNYIFSNKLKNKILQKLIEFIIVITISYIIGYLIFYKYINTEDINKEQVIKQAITEQKLEKVKQEISSDPGTSNEIKETTQINKNIDFDNPSLNKDVVEKFNLLSINNNSSSRHPYKDMDEGSYHKLYY